MRLRARWLGAAPLLFVFVALACGRRAQEPVTADANAPLVPAAAPAAGPSASDEADAAADALDRHVPKFTLGPLPADAPFEGSLSLRVALGTDPDEPTATYTFLIKGKKLRWELFAEGGKGVSAGFRIYDGAQRKFFTYLRQQAVVQVTDAALLRGDAGAPHAYTFTPFAPDPKGRVLGIPCDRVQTEDDRYRYDVCLASGLPSFPLALLGHGLAVAAPFTAALDREGQFPLNVVLHPREAASGARRRLPRRVGSLTVLKVDRGRVPEAAFELPAYPFVQAPTLGTARPLR